MQAYFFVCVVLVILFYDIEAKFISNQSPATATTKCIGSNQTLLWKYDEHLAIKALIVVWRKDLNMILAFQPETYTYSYGKNYDDHKIKHLGNGSIVLYNLTKNDSGSYFCEVTYTSGTTITSSPQMMTVACDSSISAGASRGITHFTSTSSNLKEERNGFWKYLRHHWWITLTVMMTV